MKIYAADKSELMQVTKVERQGDNLVLKGKVFGTMPMAATLTPEQARYHPYSNVITRCVGANEQVEPDVFAGPIAPGDVFLLASDGLTGMVEDRRLQQLLASKAAPGRVVDALIAEANGRGGLDNITAIIVQVHAVDPAGAPVAAPRHG